MSDEDSFKTVKTENKGFLQYTVYVVLFSTYFISYVCVFLNLPQCSGDKFTNGIVFSVAEFVGIITSNKIIRKYNERYVFMLGAVFVGVSSVGQILYTYNPWGTDLWVSGLILVQLYGVS